ncbi:hypothetical protein GC167_00165 [bacterium]|nr:hypothetical protein [bacterium]
MNTRTSIWGLWAVLLAAVASCQTSSSSDAEASISETKVVSVANAHAEFAVDGMVCAEGCAGTIQKTLSETAGIAHCTVDFGSGKVAVDYDSTLIAPDRMVAVVEAMHDGQYSVRL